MFSTPMHFESIYIGVGGWGGTLFIHIQRRLWRMCVAKRGQQAKRVDVKAFKRRLRDEEEMFESKEGARALPADPPGASGGAPLLSHRFSYLAVFRF